MEVSNPYAAPNTQSADSTEQRYYSPGQVFLAAILGGPLAAGYLVSRDHSLFGSPKKARATLLWTFVVIIGMIGLGYALPERSSQTIPAAIVAVM
jgi:hypothetical protein